MYKQSINLIICPTYNLDINSKSSQSIDLTYLSNTIDQLVIKYDIKSVTISGGELYTLSDFYLDFLCKLCKSYFEDINVVTSLQYSLPAIINNFNNITVPINPITLDNKTKNNIIALQSSKNISVISYDIYCQNNKAKFITELNKLQVKSWKIIPYIVNPLNTNKVLNIDNIYENTIKDYLALLNSMKFAFINKLELDNIKNNNNFNTQDVIITPTNKLALIKFKESAEYYEEYNSVEELDIQLNILLDNVRNSCKDCKFKSKCLTNHYNLEELNQNKCNYRNLILWYNKE